MKPDLWSKSEPSYRPAASKAAHSGSAAGSYRSTLSFSQPARSRSSSCTALVIARVKGTSSWMASTREPAGLAVGGGVDLPDQPVVVQDRQREVAPTSLGLRLVHLQHVLVLEQVGARPGRAPGDRTATAARFAPSNGFPSAAGSTRHSPRTPSTIAGSPDVADRPRLDRDRRPSSRGRCRVTAAAARSVPGAPRRPGRRACRPGTRARPRPRARCRPRRPAMATSPRLTRNSSICVTFRSLVQPVDGHDTTLVSGMSRDSSGPDVPSRSRMSRRNRSLARSHSRALRAWATPPCSAR